MPFSELLRFSKGKVDPTQQRTSNLSSDLSCQGDSDCCELVWENGQIVMRNQSGRDRKGSFCNNLPSFVSKPQDGKDAKNSKGKFSSTASALNDFPLSAPPCDIGLDEDDSTVPWLNCPVVEPFNNGYCPDILPESYVVTGNEFTQSNSTANSLRLQQGSTSKIPSSATELGRLRNGEASSFMQSQRTMPRSGNSEVTCSEAGNARHVDLKDTIPCSSSMGGSMGMKLHKSNEGQPTNASGLTNFSYFSRFASLSAANTRNTATNAGAATSCTQTAGVGNKGSVGFTQQESGSHAQPSMPPFNGRVESVPPQSDVIPPEQSVPICLERDGKCEKSSVPTKLVADAEKITEPAVATSSVCSGNSLERDSNDPANSLKRKCQETGDSEGPSEEVEGESVGVHKSGHNRAGSKRSRAAEVHNQSERRRRERINEKMRALQELIPNCNKVDKASMLDEAIEYLKTLQLQLQILSMGTGMYLSPMMLPAAMQHIHRAQMSQFSQMGIGMGAALGLGMGMPDVNTMMQMSSMQGPCYPVSGPPISSPSGFYGAVSSSHQGLGHLGQGLSVSTPLAPHPHLAGMPMRLPMGNVSGMPGMADVLANNSMNQGPTQGTIVLNDQSHASNVDESQNANEMINSKHS